VLSELMLVKPSFVSV